MPEVESTVDAPGHPEGGLVGLMGHYWADFQYFRKDALNSARHGDLLRTHRATRAGLFSFLAYLIGLANRWEGPDDRREVDGRTPVSLNDRLVALAGRFQATGPPGADVADLAALVARCSNPEPQDEVELLRDLAIEQVDPAEQRVIAWIEDFTAATGLPRYSGDHWPFPAPTEEYRDFEAIADDPLAFQDPPGTWVEMDGPPDPDPVSG